MRRLKLGATVNDFSDQEKKFLWDLLHKEFDINIDPEDPNKPILWKPNKDDPYTEYWINMFSNPTYTIQLIMKRLMTYWAEYLDHPEQEESGVFDEETGEKWWPDILEQGGPAKWMENHQELCKDKCEFLFWLLT